MHRIRVLAHLGWIALIVLLVLFVGTRFRPQPAVRAGVREITPRESFLAGDQRSLPILQDISATLRQIDARLAKIEKAVATAVGRDGRSQPPGIDP